MNSFCPEYHFKRMFSDNWGKTLTSVKRLRGGKNNQVYKLITIEGQQLLGKLYFTFNPPDQTQRLLTEFKSLYFLFSHNVRTIPKPIWMDYRTQTGIYEYLKGEKADQTCISLPDLFQAADFISHLFRLKEMAGAKAIGPASEACLTPASYLLAVENRLQQLKTAVNGLPKYREVIFFIERVFKPIASKILKKFKNNLPEYEKSWRIQPTLSPSDFGFHNAIRADNGILFFFDFEYFGWDDPAKLIADFFHHPSMKLSLEQKYYFLDTFIELSGVDQSLRRRVERLLPIVGLKWCLLMLNVCIPQIMERKRFAGNGIKTQKIIQAQLAKSANKLEMIYSLYL